MYQAPIVGQILSFPGLKKYTVESTVQMKKYWKTMMVTKKIILEANTEHL